MKFSENDLELFNDALESGIINLDAVRNDMIKKKREAILANHPYSIWQGKDGRWRSYLEDKTHASGRKLIVKTDKAALEKLT